uniref:Peroxisomal sarcosine oxidase-like n=2 Tax=Hirondellea gigas TaxID=1518452 RepID=A0A6A7FSK0_9CRUS
MQSVGVHLPLTPLKIAVCYWRMRDPTLTFPVFVSTDEKSGNYYGLPSIEYPGLVKVCLHTGVPCDPDNRDLVNMDELNASSCKYISKHFPCLEPRPAIVESCMYTVTPDKQMILDTVPGCTNIAYACGFSGTGFKLGPIVGRLMCQMVTGKPLDYNVKRFSAARFTTAS